MFNIVGERNSLRYHNYVIRKMERQERLFYLGVKKVYHKQVIDIADIVDKGKLRESDQVIEDTSKELARVFSTNYKRVAQEFSDWTFSEIDKEKCVIAVPSLKVYEEEFWREYQNYSEKELSKKITIVNASQKALYRNIIDKGLREGTSHKEIAKEILKKGVITERYKALRIARTETHSIANYSIHKSVQVTGRRMEKEWSSSADERVRSKQFNHKIVERVPMDSTYIETGEELEYPGDSSGSAGNVCNCRCVEKFYTL